MTIKELKALAKACRSVGISHYECGDVKFDLTPYDPKLEKTVTKKVQLAEESAMERIKNMSEDDLLLYSSTPYTGTEV